MNLTLQSGRDSVAVLQGLAMVLPSHVSIALASPGPLPAFCAGGSRRGFQAGRGIFAQRRSTWARVQSA